MVKTEHEVPAGCRPCISWPTLPRTETQNGPTQMCKEGRTRGQSLIQNAVDTGGDKDILLGPFSLPPVTCGRFSSAHGALSPAHPTRVAGSCTEAAFKHRAGTFAARSCGFKEASFLSPPGSCLLHQGPRRVTCPGLEGHRPHGLELISPDLQGQPKRLPAPAPRIDVMPSGVGTAEVTAKTRREGYLEDVTVKSY